MDVEIHDRNGVRVQRSTPFEIKTGKVSYSLSHESQVSLYAMMNNAMGQCDFGLLCYLKEGVNMRYVEINDNKKRDLIIQRNNLVHYLKYLERGPELRSDVRFCSECEQLLSCCLIGKLYEPAALAKFDSFRPDLVSTTLDHLNREEFEFFERWIKMIYLEEKDAKTDSRDRAFWNVDAVELERKERAIAKLSLHKFKEESLEYVFKRSSSFRSLGILPVDLQFHKNSDKIVLSLEDDAGELIKIGFVNGSIKSIDENYVTVQLDEKLKYEFMDQAFRLDIVPMNQNYSHLYSSILRLMKQDKNSQILRDLIIGKRTPTFNQSISSCEIDLARRISRGLNLCQQDSILQSLKMDDFLLINGNPGSGKTETIVRIVKLFAEMKRSVLITAHTNQAVDNILLKLLKHNVKFMRIGRTSKMNTDILPYSEDHLIRNCTSTFELKKIYSSFNVFAGTCISMNSHLIFNFRSIEYCIVDEASQLNLPENLLPLFNCKKFILVGDPHQLPPIVRSSAARAAGLDQTLFNLLFNENNHVELNIQYRMNSEIMRIANACTYKNQLTCGSREVANQVLSFSDYSLIDLDSDIEIEYDNELYIDKCLSEKLSLSVVFVDTDSSQAAAHQTDGNGEINNPFEVGVVIKILGQLIERRLNKDEIGIITPFQRQVKSLKAYAKFYNVEVSTIDQYQGRFNFNASF